MDATNSVSITGGGYTAQISLIGGQLLSLTHHEDELVVPASSKTEGAFAGAVLAPWPNRTAGGSYSYAGTDYSLPVNEEATGAALHGLMTELPLLVRAQKDTEVQLQGTLQPTAGYPFELEIALTYRVSADIGLTATLMARYNAEDEAEQTHELAVESSTAPAEAAEPAELTDGTEIQDTESEEAVSEDGVSEDAVAEEAASQDAESENTESDDSVSNNSVSEDTGSETPVSEHTDTTPSADDDAAPRPRTAPFGAGFHPYLTAGGASLKECRLRLPARTMLKTSADGTVTGRKKVTGDFDLNNGPLLAGRRIDHAFTDLPEEGWTAELVHGPSGFVVRMIAESPWVQVYTGERIDRAGVAIEPMTCPPNALNTGEDLIDLVPGEWFRLGYSIEAIRVD